MSRTYLTITAAVLSVFALPAHAQTTTKVTQSIGTNVDASNVVRARFVKPGDVSPEEYQRLLAEADKIRAYQAKQGQYTTQYQPQYVTGPAQPLYGQQVQYQQPQPLPQAQPQPQPLAYPAQTNGQIQGPFYQAQTQTVPSSPVQTYSYGQTYQTQPVQPTQPVTYAPVQPRPVQPQITQTVPATYATPQIGHSVSKGDTLYNISKRYGVPLSAIRQANGLSTNTISIGQRIAIPSVQKVISTPASTVMVPVQTYQQPQYVTRPQTPVQPQPQYVPQTYQTQPYTAPVQTYVQPSTYRPVSYQGAYPGTLHYGQASQVRASTSGTKATLIRTTQPVPPAGVYAVLPKDTLYSISKIACVKSDDIAKINGITDVSTLQPGQRLSMPTGHCLR